MSTNQWACDKNTPAWEAMGEDCSYSVRMPGFLKYYMEITVKHLKNIG